LIARAKELFRAAPVRDVWLHPAAGDLRALASAPALGRLTALDFGGNHLGDQGVRVVAASPHVSRLEQLDLRGNGLTDEAVRTLAASPSITRLKRLYLGGNYLGTSALTALAASPRLATLTTLQFGDHSAGWRPVDLASLREDVTALARLRHLATLDLSGSVVLGHSSTLFNNPVFAQLTHLVLKYCSVGDLGWAILAESTLQAQLTTLDLSKNGINGETEDAFAVTRQLPRLTRLNLSQNAMRLAGAEALAAS